MARLANFSCGRAHPARSSTQEVLDEDYVYISRRGLGGHGADADSIRSCARGPSDDPSRSKADGGRRARGGVSLASLASLVSTRTRSPSDFCAQSSDLPARTPFSAPRVRARPDTRRTTGSFRVAPVGQPPLPRVRAPPAATVSSRAAGVDAARGHEADEARRPSRFPGMYVCVWARLPASVMMCVLTDLGGLQDVCRAPRCDGCGHHVGWTAIRCRA